MSPHEKSIAVSSILHSGTLKCTISFIDNHYVFDKQQDALFVWIVVLCYTLDTWSWSAISWQIGMQLCYMISVFWKIWSSWVQWSKRRNSTSHCSASCKASWLQSTIFSLICFQLYTCQLQRLCCCVGTSFWTNATWASACKRNRLKDWATKLKSISCYW